MIIYIFKNIFVPKIIKLYVYFNMVCQKHKRKPYKPSNLMFLSTDIFLKKHQHHIVDVMQLPKHVPNGPSSFFRPIQSDCAHSILLFPPCCAQIEILKRQHCAKRQSEPSLKINSTGITIKGSNLISCSLAGPFSRPIIVICYMQITSQCWTMGQEASLRLNIQKLRFKLVSRPVNRQAANYCLPERLFSVLGKKTDQTKIYIF